MKLCVLLGLVVGLGVGPAACGGGGHGPAATGGATTASRGADLPTAKPPATVAPDVPTGAAAARDAELAAKVAGYVDAFANLEPVFSRDGKRVVFVSTRDGLPQLYVADDPAGPATRLLTTTQRMTGAMTTLEGKALLFKSDTGADENWSFFRVGLDGNNLIELTPGPKLNRDDFFVPDGRPSTMFFTARKMSEPRTTVYSASTIAASEPKAIYTDEKPAFLTDVSPDGKLGLVNQFPSRMENHLLAIDLTTGKASAVYPLADTASGNVTIFEAKLSADGKRIYVGTDGGEEQALILALDLKGKVLAKYAVTPATAQITGIAVAKEGGLVAVSLLAGNHAEIRLLDGKKLTVKTDVQMPLGQGNAGEFSQDGKRLSAQWSTPRTPTEIFAIDTSTGKAEPLRREDRPSLKAVPQIDATIVEIPAFDGGKIPTNIYMPSGQQTKRHPVIVAYHGGPAGTSVIRWNISTAFYLTLGYVVVEPNVRGSGGFGRAFEAADDGPKRLDAFKDIETSARWIAAQPWADKDRLVVYGGSYGGYTTLIALSRWPELWRAGIDLFGVADLKSFMASTSGIIHDVFLVEFGDPTKDAEFLASISPSRDVSKIVDPTFVYAGANDPRVPRTESDSIVRALRQHRVPTEYMVADNEGHSVAHRENQIALFSRVARFLEAHLR